MVATNSWYFFCDSSYTKYIIELDEGTLAKSFLSFVLQMETASFYYVIRYDIMQRQINGLYPML